MNYKNRIRISLAILILLPLVMTCIGAICICAYQEKYTELIYGALLTAPETVTNPTKVLDSYTHDLYNKIYEMSEANPNKLLDKEYLDSINDTIDSRYAFIAIRQQDSFVYIGNEGMFSKIDSDFPEFGKQMTDEQAVYQSGNMPVLLKQIDFVTDDEKENSAFIVVSMEEAIPQLKGMTVHVVVQFLLIVIATAMVLVVWLYKSMLKPLRALSKAANSIAQGDLDFEITDYIDDEIGSLCKDFEFMRKKLKENVEKQQVYERESRELISNISHDLKTPLTAIKGYTEGLMDAVATTKEKQDKYLQTIYRKANDMSSLVDELGLYAKIGMDAIVYDFKQIKVNEYFNEWTESFGIDSEMLNINISYHNYVSQDTKIIADCEQLKRVLYNILNNSIKYMDKETKIIDIRLEEDEKFVTVSIEDNGKGVGSDDLDKIFDRCYRTDASRNSKQGGTGLGLAISKKIVEDHGGKIWAKSSEGVGTTISFSLCKVDNEQGKSEEIITDETNKKQKSGRIRKKERR